MQILDLFCGAGGAAMGYHRAFPEAEIIGVDINPQPRYPFTFVQADAMTYPLDGFDFIHASPPCHDHSNATAVSRSTAGKRGTGWMLNATIDRLRDLAVPWVVENVGAATMPTDIYVFRLCGSSFGLDLRRHRLFASNMPISPPKCAHGWQTPRFPSLYNANRKAGRLSPVVGVHGNTQYVGDFALRCAAMGIDWMTNAELAQAIPPAYTEYIGNQWTA